MGAAAARAASEMQNYQGVHKQSAGFRLLASMGWQEGQGLVRTDKVFSCNFDIVDQSLIRS